jgi:hypothetical protein
MRLHLAIACVAAVAAINAAAAAEVCSELRPVCQHADLREQRPAVAGRQQLRSGPRQRLDESGAWCEGAPGPGIGQTITVFQKPPEKVGAMMVANGYAKSADAFQANGRVKRAKVETGTGFSKIVTLKDTKEMQEIKFPPGKPAWLKLTILEGLCRCPA